MSRKKGNHPKRMICLERFREFYICAFLLLLPLKLFILMKYINNFLRNETFNTNNRIKYYIVQSFFEFSKV